MSSDRDRERRPDRAPEAPKESPGIPGKATRVERELGRHPASGDQAAAPITLPPPERSAFLPPRRPYLEQVRSAVKASQGTALPDPETWSARIGGDVSGAEIVHGPDAAAAAEALGARAFTVGKRVFFGAGYDETTDDGELLAHELTHVVQQRGQVVPDVDDLEVLEHDDPRETAARGQEMGPSSATAIARDTKKAGSTSPAKPLAAESSLLAILQTPVDEGDEKAAQHRKKALVAALAAIPERDRLALLTRLGKPAPNDQLATVFKTNLAEATRQAVLDVLRYRVTAVDEKSQPLAIQPFLASVQPSTVRQHPPTPVIDGAWHRAAFINLVCTGIAAPTEPAIELTWSVVDRVGDSVQNGTAPWVPGAIQAAPIVVRAGTVGTYVVIIDVVARGLIAKRIEHVITVDAGGSAREHFADLAPDAPLKGDSRDAARPTQAIGRAADAMTDAQIGDQAASLRKQLAVFDGKTGAELAQNKDYKRLRAALDELEWQGANRVTDGKRVDTHAPGSEVDQKSGTQAELPMLSSIKPEDRGAVRSQVEALVRRHGLAGARAKIAEQRQQQYEQGAGAGAAAPAPFEVFEEELAALEATHSVPVAFDTQARRLGLGRLKTSEEQIKKELERYGLKPDADPQGDATQARTEPNAAFTEMIAEAKKLAALKKRAMPRAYEEDPSLPKPDKEERDALDAEYQLALQAAAMKYPTLLLFAESPNNQKTPRMGFPEDFDRTPVLAGQVGADLRRKLADIATVRKRLNESGDTFVWEMPSVIEATKPLFRIAPGTVASAVIDARVNPPQPTSLAERMQLIFTLALGALMALPSGGASLLTVAGELAFVASDLHQVARLAGEKEKKGQLANTALDPAQALIAEVPESAELLLALIALPIGGGGAVRAMREARAASQATRTLREALIRHGGDLAHPEVMAASGGVRTWAMKAFHNDVARVDAYLEQLAGKLGKRTMRLATTVERASKVSEYGTEALARRFGISKITIAEDLKATAQVRHGVVDGRLVVSEVRVGPTTTVSELLDHVGTIEAIERYNGVVGKLRHAWDRVVEKVTGTRRVNPFLSDPDSPGFKVFEEVRKHELMLRSRMSELAGAADRNDAAARGLLQDEISFYEGELSHWNRQAREAEAGNSVAVGFGIEARRPADVHREALEKGYPKLADNQQYRRTGRSGAGQEYEPYVVQSSRTERDALDASAVSGERTAAPTQREPGTSDVGTGSSNGNDVATRPKRELPHRPLSAKEEAELQAKVRNRTISPEDWERLQFSRRLKNRRSRGVNRFWAEERRKLREGKPGTRNWTPEQREDILAGRTPKHGGEPIEGHHRHNVADYPDIADQADTIYPVTKDEHVNRWHGGDFQNDTSGQPLDPDYPEDF